MKKIYKQHEKQEQKKKNVAKFAYPEYGVPNFEIS